MNKLTAKEITNIINSDIFEEFDHEPKSWFYEDICKNIEDVIKYITNITDEFVHEFKRLGKFVEVEKFGGEGKGDSYYRVYHFIDHDVYLQFDGWYTSHEGAEYEKMFEVQPKQVTKTVYYKVS